MLVACNLTQGSLPACLKSQSQQFSVVSDLHLSFLWHSCSSTEHLKRHSPKYLAYAAKQGLLFKNEYWDKAETLYSLSLRESISTNSPGTEIYNSPEHTQSAHTVKCLCWVSRVHQFMVVLGSSRELDFLLGS